MMTASGDLCKILLTEEQLAARVRELGAKITEDYRGKLDGKPLLVVGMLKGSFIFMSDLVRNIDLHCEIDFMSASSYGNSTHSSGYVTIKQDVKDIRDQHVLIVEDIVDSGFTMKNVLALLKSRNPASLALCSLLDKPSRRDPSVGDICIDYLGFSIEDEFVVGYGLDYASRYRNLPYIGVLKQEMYANN